MPAFILEYKLPSYVDDSEKKKEFLRRLTNIADLIQSNVSNIFYGWRVGYKIREIEISSNMPDIGVTGWVTDNEDDYKGEAIQAQAEIVRILEEFCYEDETVDSWFQRVKGKWSESKGRMARLPHPAHGCLDI